MRDNHNDDAPPAGASRFMVLVLALLVVAALTAWFLLGGAQAPGPAEDSFEDTAVAPAGQVLNAPLVTEAPTNTAP